MVFKLERVEWCERELQSDVVTEMVETRCPDEAYSGDQRARTIQSCCQPSTRNCRKLVLSRRSEGSCLSPFVTVTTYRRLGVL